MFHGHLYKNIYRIHYISFSRVFSIPGKIYIPQIHILILRLAAGSVYTYDILHTCGTQYWNLYYHTILMAKTINRLYTYERR